MRPSTITGKSNALVPTIPYLVFQRSPALSPGAVPTNSFPLGTMMMFDWRSMPNSSVRAKMIEPSLGLIVMPVQAGAVDGWIPNESLLIRSSGSCPVFSVAYSTWFRRGCGQMSSRWLKTEWRTVRPGSRGAAWKTGKRFAAKTEKLPTILPWLPAPSPTSSFGLLPVLHWVVQ